MWALVFSFLEKMSGPRSVSARQEELGTVKGLTRPALPPLQTSLRPPTLPMGPPWPVHPKARGAVVEPGADWADSGSLVRTRLDSWSCLAVSWGATQPPKIKTSSRGKCPSFQEPLTRGRQHADQEGLPGLACGWPAAPLPGQQLGRLIPG